MVESSNLRYWLHRLFAYPLLICWIIGTLALWIPVSLLFLESGVFDVIFTHPKVLFAVVLSYATTSGLGFFAGSFSFFWLVIGLARRVNGAPHEVGESVLVLSGPFSGRVSTIYNTSIGQGGQPIQRVDLGAEAKENYSDTFDEWSLLRLSPRPTPNQSQQEKQD